MRVSCALSSVARRHICHYTRGIFTITLVAPAPLFDQPRHQVGKLEQIRNSKRRAALADDHLWIGGDHICPLRWHRADVVFLHAQQEPPPISVVSLAGADELPSGEGVKWVGHTYKARARVRRACSSC